MSNAGEANDRILTCGSLVKLQNLQAAAHLNGTTGTVIRHLALSGRYEIRFDNSNDDPEMNKPLAVRRENLIILRTVFGRETDDPELLIAHGNCFLCNDNKPSTEQQLECLGGLSLGAVNNVATEGSSIYASLPRPAKLHLYHLRPSTSARRTRTPEWLI